MRFQKKIRGWEVFKREAVEYWRKLGKKNYAQLYLSTRRWHPLDFSLFTRLVYFLFLFSIRSSSPSAFLLVFLRLYLVPRSPPFPHPLTRFPFVLTFVLFSTGFPRRRLSRSAPLQHQLKELGKSPVKTR